MTATEMPAGTPRDPYHWLLRIALASSFLYHGFNKFGNLEAGAENFGPSLPIWTLVAVGETLIGLGILVAGFLHNTLGDLMTRTCGAGSIVILVGAIVLVH